jgi:hypothetical protein
MKPLLLMTICLFTITGWSFDAASQPVNAAAIEGYVYDRNTLRPLSNVGVLFIHTLDNSGATLTSAAITDSNGFYSLDGGELEGVSSQILAECNLRRGVASPTGSMAPVLQPRVYQQNIYISLPRTDTRCQAASH